MNRKKRKGKYYANEVVEERDRRERLERAKGRGQLCENEAREVDSDPTKNEVILGGERNGFMYSAKEQSGDNDVLCMLMKGGDEKVKGMLRSLKEEKERLSLLNDTRVIRRISDPVHPDSPAYQRVLKQR